MPGSAKKRRADEAISNTKDKGSKESSTKRSKAMPSSLNSTQKAAIQQFVALTQTDKKSAEKFLKSTGWDVQAAANSYFSGSHNAASSSARPKLTKIFDQYRDQPKEEPDEINMDGMMSLLGDTGVSIENVQLLIFSELVQSPTLGNITRQGFVDGLSQESATDLSKIKTLVQNRESALSKDRALLKRVYKHTFVLARAQGQKSVALEQATEYWRLLFSPPSLSWKTSKTPWLDWWVDFLNEKWKKSVNKDMWDQTLSFAEKTLQDEDLAFWSEDSAWPGVIDEFVEWVKTKRQAGGDVMDVS